MAILITFIELLFQILTWAIFIRIILSWFRLDPYHPLIQLLDQITEPILAPIRSVMPAMGGFDFSPIVAIILLQVIEQFLIRLLI